jgi:hypothetical protein
MTKKIKERTVESITDYLPPKNYRRTSQSDNVEYFFAYALYKIGVKTIKFGSYGLPGARKAAFNSIQIESDKKIEHNPFLWALLDLFKIRFSGGANSKGQQAAWGENKPLVKNPIINGTYLYFDTENCTNFVLMVNGYLTWLNQKEHE